MINDLISFLRKHSFNAVAYGNTVRVMDEELPVYLEVRFDGNKVYASIGFTDDLRDALEEAILNGRNVDEAVEEALSRLNICALLVKKWVDERGLIMIFKLRDGSIELTNLLEELKEGLEE